MGTGKIRECDECHEMREHAANGLCHTCYRRVDRIVKGNQAARSEREFDKTTQYFRKAQGKMVKAVYDLRNILGVFKEYGAASEFLEEDSKTVSILTELLVPLLDKVSATVKPGKPLIDPMPGPSHVQTVMDENYIQGPFTGRLSQPEPENLEPEEEERVARH